MSKYLYLDFEMHKDLPAIKKFLEEIGMKDSNSSLFAIELKQEIEILTSCLREQPKDVTVDDITEKGLVLWILLSENIVSKTVDVVVFIPFDNIASVASDFPYNFDGKIMNIGAWRKKNEGGSEGN